MKKVIMLFFVASVFGMILFNGCTEDEACNSLSMSPTVDRTFAFDGIVFHKDHNPYTGSVTLTMYKTYCNGDENGKKVINLETKEDGTWNSNWLQTYTYTNYDDFVTLEIYIQGESGDSERKIFRWSDVENNLSNGFVYYSSRIILDY